jgi:hypothetical protein
MAYCDKKRLWKKCIYEGTKKYLVITSDRVECLSRFIAESQFVALSMSLSMFIFAMCLGT